MKQAKRELKVIEDELHNALRGETRSIIEAGELLIEANKQVEHGEWLPWLQNNFRMSERSARNRMQAARWADATKSATVADLDFTIALPNLSPTALYAISADVFHDDFPEAAITAILREAETKRVGKVRAHEIAAPFVKAERAAQRAADAEAARIIEEGEAALAAEEAARAEADAEAAALLDGPPPELPPTETPQSIAAASRLAAFDRYVSGLKELRTKSVRSFTGTAHSASELNEVADFLRQIAEGLRGKEPDADHLDVPDSLRVHCEEEEAA